MELLDKVQLSFDMSDQDVKDITDGEYLECIFLNILKMKETKNKKLQEPFFIYVGKVPEIHIVRQ